MSDCIGPSSRSCRSASRGGKPRHVKCLNFGQSILELDVAKQLGCFATSNRALVIEQSVARIPCTEKKDYVRKWIETHEDGGSDLSDDLPRVSPSRETSTSEGSPVLGNIGKRHRKGTRKNRHAVTRNVDDTDGQDTQCSAKCTTQQDSGNKGENQNKQEYLHKTQCTTLCTKVIADGSPILGTRLYSYKRRRRKLWYGTEDHVSSKRLKLHDDKITNTRIELDSNCDNLHEMSIDHNKLEEDSGSSVKETVYQIETEESPKSLQIYTTEISLSQTPQRLSSKDSSSHKNNKVNPRIEIDTSDESDEGEYNKFSSTNSSTNNSLSNVVEEVDTQDMLPGMRKIQLSASLFTSRSLLKASQLLSNDSNETYCSEAEMLQDQSTHLSAKVSLVPSLTREVTGSKSTQTPVISTISTPSKVSPDKAMYARLLDSGKKSHKAKK